MGSAAKVKTVVSACAAALVFSLVILGFFGMDEQTNAAVHAYLNSIGWQVDDKPAEISHFKIPEEFDTVFSTYNTFQLEAGLDLSNYRGMRVARYSYTVKNHLRAQDGEVRANVYVHKDTIVAADISQTGSGGFIQAITDTSEMTE